MLIANLAVLAIIAALAVYQFLKGTLIKAFATIIVAICSNVVAFGYFEVLANLLAGYVPSAAAWAQTICFAVLFILCFALMQTGVVQLMRGSIDFGLLPERIGRVLCGIFLGLIVAGVALTAVGMAPLSDSYPYSRFDATNPDAGSPGKVFLNPDGLVTGLFSMVSSGSFSGNKSFAVLHADFLNQTYLNRNSFSSGVSIRTATEAIETPREIAAWDAPQDIRDETGKPVSPKSGYKLVIVRVGIKQAALNDAGQFTISQLRLICKPSNGITRTLAGKGQNVYPLGHMISANQVQRKRLSDRIRLQNNDFNEGTRWIDWLFQIPSETTAVLVEFKQNNAQKLSQHVRADKAPQVIPFVESSGQGSG